MQSLAHATVASYVCGILFVIEHHHELAAGVAIAMIAKVVHLPVPLLLLCPGPPLRATLPIDLEHELAKSMASHVAP